MNQWTYLAGGRHQGASAGLNALLVAISRHPDATPEALRTLELLFPERMAEVQAQ